MSFSTLHPRCACAPSLLAEVSLPQVVEQRLTKRGSVNMIYYMTMNQKDYYRILSVGHNATPEQIRQAYRNLAFQYHPDRNEGNPSATERMKEINEAYATLSNAQKRREYDALRERYGDLAYERFSRTHRQEDIFRNSDIHQIFEEFARTFGFRGPGDIFGEFYDSRSHPEMARITRLRQAMDRKVR